MNTIVTTNTNEIINDDVIWQKRAIQIRNKVIKDRKAVKYLLSTEINRLFEYELDSNKLMLYKMLWSTGVRLNELLALKVSDVTFDDDLTYINVRTAKRKDLVYRQIDIMDQKIVQQLKIYISTNRIKSYNKLFTITDRTVENWLKNLQKIAESDGVTFQFNITPKVFRHSYAIHLFYNRISDKIISKNLGHKYFRSTEVYMNILAIESASMRRILF